MYVGYDLERADDHPPETASAARSRWSGFRSKPMVMSRLLEDQYGLCAYSEWNAAKEGLGFHIEHVRPKSRYPQETFAWKNLVASALTKDDLQRLRGEEVFGGHAKLRTFDEHAFISPLSQDSCHYFKYVSDGRVVPSYDLAKDAIVRVEYTIDTLNLNCSFLVNRRRRLWNELEGLYNDHIENDWSLYDLVSIEILSSNCILPSFFSLRRQFFGSISESVLQSQCLALL